MRGDVATVTVQRMLQAVKQGDNFTLQEILEANRGQPALQPHLNQALVLACCCRTTTPDILRLLLRAKPDVTYADREGNRPLHYAATSGNVEAVKLLLNYGTPASVVCERGATALVKAIEAGRLGVVELLLQKGVTVNRPRTYDDGDTPLHVAARLGRTDIVRLLMAKGADPRAVNKLEAGASSPLHLAVKGRHFTTVDTLCSLRANVNQTDGGGSTPLHEAVKNSSLKCIRILLEHHAYPDKPNKQGQTSLHLAASATAAGTLASDMVSMLLQGGAKVDQKTAENYNALHFCAISGNAQVANQLLSAGINTRQVTLTSGETPLHLAITHGRDEVAHALLTCKNHVNITNKAGDTPLHRLPVSRVVDKPGLLDALLAQGAHLNTLCRQGTYPLDRCVFSASVGGTFCEELLYRLVAGGSKLQKNVHAGISVLRRSALCWLTWHGELTSARFLVNAGWDLQQERQWLLLPGKDDVMEDFLRWLRELVDNPSPLRTLCRTRVRLHLRAIGNDTDLVALISLLPLPVSVQAFLRLDNEVCSS